MDRKKLLFILSLCLLIFLIPNLAFANGSSGSSKDELKSQPGRTYTYTDDHGEHTLLMVPTFDFVAGDVAYKIVDDEKLQVEVAAWHWRWDCSNGNHNQYHPAKGTDMASEYNNYSATGINIPAKVKNNNKEYTVIGIGNNAFVNVNNVDITLPETITYIDNSAFWGYTNRSNSVLKIPAGVTSIGESAFCQSKVEIKFAEDSQLKNLGINSFKDYAADIEQMILPEGLEKIGDTAFSGCNFELTIPGTVMNLDQSLFGYDGGLDKIRFTEGPANFYIDNEQQVLYGYNSVIDVFNDSAKEITIPEGITSIGPKAFCDCESLETITMPNSLTVIGSGAFDGLDQLTTIKGENNVTKVGEAAFRNCSNITAFDLSNVKEIGSAAFDGCSQLECVSWPNALEEMGESAFNNCGKLKNAIISGTLTEIPSLAFAGCVSLEQISLPEGLESIGQYAFDLTVYEGNNPVNKNPKLQSINIPSTVTYLGENFLGGVIKDKTALIFEGEKPPTFNAAALVGIDEDKPVIYFPADAVDAYTKKDSALVNAGLVTAPQEGETPSNSYSLEVTAPTTTLYSGDQLALDVISTIPFGGKLSAESSNPDVAQVTTVQDGKVTVKSLSKGSATITLSIYDSNGILLTSKTVDLTFSEPPYTGKYSYEISVAQPDNGSVAVDKYATEGETVTITATPDDGYMLDTLSVTAGGKELEVTDNGDGTYSFTMPSSKVSITAAFAEDPDWVEPEQPEEPSTTVADIFSDVVPGAWYTDAVQYAYDNGLMTGTSATTFEPNTTTTRGMIVSMLHRLEGSPAVGIADFSDVASGDWYADPVAWAASEGIVGGYGDGTFGPNDPITREQMASILYRYADYKGLDMSARASLDAYSDADSVSPWASDVMSWAVSEGIISGMTEDTLAPQGTATRAQVAAMFQRFLENVMA